VSNSFSLIVVIIVALLEVRQVGDPIEVQLRLPDSRRGCGCSRRVDDVVASRVVRVADGGIGWSSIGHSTE